MRGPLFLKVRFQVQVHFINYALAIVFWADIFIANVALSTFSAFLRSIQRILQILQAILSSFSSSLLWSFVDSAKLLHCLDGPGCCYSWGISSLFSGVSSKFFRDSIGNSYCKKDYSKGEVNAAEITQIRLQKIKKNVVMVRFYWLVKFWKKKYFMLI